MQSKESVVSLSAEADRLFVLKLNYVLEKVLQNFSLLSLILVEKPLRFLAKSIF